MQELTKEQIDASLKKREEVYMEFHKRFLNGEQHLKVGFELDIIKDDEKDFYWQSREVFNKIQSAVVRVRNEYKLIPEKDIYSENGLVSKLVPLQRKYNDIKNRAIENFYKSTYGNILVEDGSVDVDNLEEDGLQPGKVLVYRQGAVRPTLAPTLFDYKETELLLLSIENDINDHINNWLYQWLFDHRMNLPEQMEEDF